MLLAHRISNCFIPSMRQWSVILFCSVFYARAMTQRTQVIQVIQMIQVLQVLQVLQALQVLQVLQT
jgi:hypothetical protein